MDNERLGKNSGNIDPEHERASLGDEPEALDPTNSNRLRDQLKGQTTEHASPPRLEDEGQSGG